MENAFYLLYAILWAVCSVAIQILPSERVIYEEQLSIFGKTLFIFGMAILVPYKGLQLTYRYGTKFKDVPLNSLIKFYGVGALAIFMLFQVSSRESHLRMLDFKNQSFKGTVIRKYISNNHAERRVVISIDGKDKDFDCEYNMFESVQPGWSAIKERGDSVIHYHQ